MLHLVIDFLDSNTVLNFLVDWFSSFCTSLKYARLATDKQNGQTQSLLKAPWLVRGRGLQNNSR